MAAMTRIGQDTVDTRRRLVLVDGYGLAFRDLISEAEVQRHVSPERSRPATRGRPPASRREAGRVAVP